MKIAVVGATSFIGLELLRSLVKESNVELLAVAREPVFIIEKVEEKPLDMKKLQAMPGILVYMVKPGDELWDIARKYHTSIQEIRTINALKENQEPSPGTPLLVVKKVEGQIK